MILILLMDGAPKWDWTPSSFVESPFAGPPQEGTFQKALPSIHTWNENETHNCTS